MRDSDKIAIQEMTRIMCKPPSPFATDTPGDIFNGCYLAVMFAEKLYLAGYRKQSEGEWRPYKTPLDARQTGWICSKCSSVIYDLSNGDTDFCPNCGARMKGGE